MWTTARRRSSCSRLARYSPISHIPPLYLPISPLHLYYLPYISPGARAARALLARACRVPRPNISPISPLYLPHISPISPHISPLSPQVRVAFHGHVHANTEVRHAGITFVSSAAVGANPNPNPNPSPNPNPNPNPKPKPNPNPNPNPLTLTLTLTLTRLESIR